MSQYVESAKKTFTAGAAIARFLRVKLTTGKLAVAGASDVELGTLEEASYADLDVRGVRLRNSQGTRKMVASGAITQYAHVYGAASGKISAVAGGNYQGIALDAASADGDIIEVLPLGNLPSILDVGTVAAAGSAQGDATAITNKLTYVTAADGTKGVILPAAVAGLEIFVYSTVATNGLKIYPASGDDVNDGTTDAAITIEGKTFAHFIALDSTTWAAIYTVNT